MKYIKVSVPFVICLLACIAFFSIGVTGVKAQSVSASQCNHGCCSTHKNCRHQRRSNLNKHSKCNERNKRGPAGPQGPIGNTGPQGPAGGLSQYGYIYNEIAQVVPIEADVTFDTNGITTPGIIHAPGTSQIQVTTPGNYLVTFSASGVEPSQFAVFVNGVLVGGTVYGSGAGTQQNSGQAILALSSGDVLTLRNHSSSAAVTLQTLAGSTQTNVNASIALEKLN